MNRKIAIKFLICNDSKFVVNFIKKTLTFEFMMALLSFTRSVMLPLAKGVGALHICIYPLNLSSQYLYTHTNSHLCFCSSFICRIPSEY